MINHPWISRFDVILFDFDGLLVDTENVHFQAYKEALRRRGCALNWSFDTYIEIMHVSEPSFRREIYAEFPVLQEIEPRWEVIKKEKREIYAELLKSSPLAFMPGAEPLLKFLIDRHFPHAIVTNSSRKEMETIAAKLPFLKSVPLWVTRDDYLKPKPAPDPYLLAVEKMQLQNKRVVVFEDTLKGIEAAETADLSSILICGISHPQLREKPENLPHFENLIQLQALSSLHTLYKRR